MSINQLNIHNFRNITTISTQLEAHGANIIQGKNGSGKTSFLEAIHFLGLGKSFKTRLIDRIISHKADTFSLFSTVLYEQQKIAVGIEKGRKAHSRIRIAGKDVTTASELAEILPLQLLEPHSFLLLEGPPELRRNFIDWGVFHVEHSFLNVWKNFSRCIKQRNSALRAHNSRDEVFSWNAELIENGLKIDAARKNYIHTFCETLKGILPELLDIPSLEIHYYSGWTAEKSLSIALMDSIERDLALGYTQFGPHHADLKIKVDRFPAKEVLSRGQQKLFICAMKIAQGLLFQQVNKGKGCIYLLDDLVSELDIANQGRVLDLLADQKSQLFITCTDKQDVAQQIKTLPVKVLKMEQGYVI